MLLFEALLIYVSNILSGEEARKYFTMSAKISALVSKMYEKSAAVVIKRKKMLYIIYQN